VSGTRATVFGLDLRANRDLPFLQGAKARPTGREIDVSLQPDSLEERWSPSSELVSDQRRPDGEIVFQIERSPEIGYRIGGPAYGASVISSDGRCLWGAPGADGLPAWQRLLIAQSLPFAAVLQGLEVLHASAVAIDGGAVAFTGVSGSGKTSLAMELCRRDAEFLTDDVLALELAGEELIGHPGSPVAGLDHAEAERLRAAGVEGGPPLAVDFRERIERVATGAEPRPLQALFVLDRRPDGPAAPRFEPAADARLLIASTFNLVLADSGRLTRLLDVCALAARQLVERVVIGPEVDAVRLGDAVERRIGG
jgi:hypothetical protein